MINRAKFLSPEEFENLRIKIMIQLEEEKRIREGRSRIIEIDILEGLTENQKHMIKGLVATGQYSPMGFTVNITNGDVWYMGNLIVRCI
jgi:hypothetical protein